ncbi:MAG: carboxypeptidase-like regulatory domain-containing protein [Bacteroidota bacterium]
MFRKTLFVFGFFGILCALLIGGSPALFAQETLLEYNGTVLDANEREPLVFVSISLNDSNLSTVSNTEGEFVLKVPESASGGVLNVSLLGYEPKDIPLSQLTNSDTKIYLSPKVTELSEVNVTTFKNPEALVRRVFKDKSANSTAETVLMTAFYRETIKRRKRNVSLTEAVVDLYKLPYASNRQDIMSLQKARKSTDYRRLDTVAVKMQGGPFSTLYLDIMKYPEYIFTDESIEFYDFQFDPPTTVNDRPVYVVRFQQKEKVIGSGYQGKLYIDATVFALVSATYSLNITDSRDASDLFVRKKPRDITVSPLQASYRVDYRQKNGKWYYGYGSVLVSFKISKRRRLFNSVYTLASEMAVTDWQSYATDHFPIGKERLRPSVIIADAVSGFSDPDFWGPYNLIEPEKSIESAINKIRRKLKRNGG